MQQFALHLERLARLICGSASLTTATKHTHTAELPNKAYDSPHKMYPARTPLIARNTEHPRYRLSGVTHR